MAQPAISEEQVRDQLKRLLASRSFQPSELRNKFLRFTVEKVLSGGAGEIKEYVIGADAFGRGAEFDPRIDSVVRVGSRHVRNKLAEYYGAGGRQDPILVHFAKGSYVPSFSLRAQFASPSPGSLPSPREPSPEIPGHPNLAGRIISHYGVIEPLGQGSRASVYRAEDLRLKGGVALKFLSETLAADPARVAEFQR